LDAALAVLTSGLLKQLGVVLLGSSVNILGLSVDLVFTFFLTREFLKYELSLVCSYCTVSLVSKAELGLLAAASRLLSRPAPSKSAFLVIMEQWVFSVEALS
jgi:hypothetical protein